MTAIKLEGRDNHGNLRQALLNFLSPIGNDIGENGLRILGGALRDFAQNFAKAFIGLDFAGHVDEALELLGIVRLRLGFAWHG